ncbi:MAG: hypothetical protein AAGG07_02515 [Planctomycetota bacterium]
MAVLLARRTAPADASRAIVGLFDPNPSSEDRFLVNNQGWAILIQTAWDAGWRPEGSHPPRFWQRIGLEDPGPLTGPLRHPETEPDVPWPAADYVTGRGQRVSEEDASALGSALRSIVDDLPNHDALAEKRVGATGSPIWPSLDVLQKGLAKAPFEVFGGANKPGYLRLTEFLDRGAFEVW